MILTVTPDPVLDNILLIDTWTQGTTMKAVEQHWSVGGKGLDSSVALHHLGARTEAVTFLAGRTGKDLERLIEKQYGFQLLPLWVPGETRTAHIISELQSGLHSHIFSGGILPSPRDELSLLEELDRHLSQALFMITGGILPQSASVDLHACIIERAQAAGVPSLIDAHSQWMLSALPASPYIIKLNIHEFCITFKQKCASIDDLIRAGSSARSKHHMQNLIITCGPDGILAFTEQGKFHAQPPRLTAINAAGAGDAASAALAWRLSEIPDWPDALRWAAAVSAAVVLTPGTADCRQADIDRLLPQIKIVEEKT